MLLSAPRYWVTVFTPLTKLIALFSIAGQVNKLLLPPKSFLLVLSSIKEFEYQAIDIKRRLICLRKINHYLQAQPRFTTSLEMI